ncbi:MAG: penicillin-binding protein 2 [Parcubacteria group bacterium]|jgi:penicillin-binding protein 2|nr:penicillin-binding protein 2 [Parcubacteria group bacterium]|tara:strand:+ start:4435 stop:6363 length:1929 start_codon:yes stop_codon:yes gene_type:complete
MGLKKYFIGNRARKDIDAEEIFLDVEAMRSLEEKGKIEQPIKSLNFILFYVLIIICLSGLLFRAGYLQIARGEYYQDLAQGNRLRIYSISAPRGIIYDHLGEPLVYNIPSFDLVVGLTDFLDNPILLQEEILRKIIALIADNQDSQIDQAKVNQLREKIKEYSGQVGQLVLARGIERSAALTLESLINDWPGLRLEKNAQRQYLLGSYFSHVLGYTGQVNKRDLEIHPDYLLNDQIGKTGLEYQYEDLLRGAPGQEQIEVNSLGKTQRLLATKPAQPGQSLVLFIDKALQKKIYQVLEIMLDNLSLSGQKVKKAAALAIDPNNGGILALVSLPSFDNNLFAQSISQEDLNALERDPSRPFLNRVIAGQYPAGSTVKPLIAAAALEEGIVRAGQQLSCPGGISIVNKYNPEIIYYFPDWKTHGSVDVVEAIAESCNVFFYAVGGGYGLIPGLGMERIKEYLEYFGLGQLTGIDLFHEQDGFIPDSNQDQEWRLGDIYHAAIGQGDITATPLQIALATASIANGGILYQPQIVDRIIDSAKDIPAQVIRDDFIQPANIKTVQQGMRQAVLTGSARSLADLPVKAAGKTGTAQFGSQDQTHAWFTGFAPYEHPEIVLTILIEAGGEGHKAAVPVAKEILSWYFSQ